jgi:hypothetical protein
VSTATGRCDFSLPGGCRWSELAAAAVDMVAILAGPLAASGRIVRLPGGVFGYTTNFSGQGLAARVVYQASSGPIEELSMLSDRLWHAADLTTITNAPTAASAPFAYTTGITDQGLAARVVYRAASGQVEELSMLSDGLRRGDVPACSKTNGYGESLCPRGT